MEPHLLIEQILREHSAFLKKDIDKYRNHVYRVYAICQLTDPNPDNYERYALASVFHDIGIWTNNTFDYLEPSVALARAYLESINRHDLTGEISLMIDMHHKMSTYTGTYATTVETFRKADWTDLSKGLIRYGISKKKLKAVRKQFPGKGFHWFLVKKTISNFFSHPLRPLPMFKK